MLKFNVEGLKASQNQPLLLDSVELNKNYKNSRLQGQFGPAFRLGPRLSASDP